MVLRVRFQKTCLETPIFPVSPPSTWCMHPTSARTSVSSDVVISCTGLFQEDDSDEDRNPSVLTGEDKKRERNEGNYVDNQSIQVRDDVGR